MGSITITGSQLLLGLIILIVGILAIIFYFRMRYSRLGASNLNEKHKNTAKSSPLDGRNKYAEVDPFRLSTPIWLFGFAASLFVMVLAFNWTQFEEDSGFVIEYEEFEDDIEMEPPRTAEPPPPPPPPPPPVIEEVPDEEILEEEEPVFEDQDIEVDEVLEEAEPEDDAPPPPPPPPPPKKKEPDFFRKVESMPMFPGCEKKKSKEEREACTNQKMLEFVNKNVKYPAIARETGIQGRAIIEFKVDKDGSIVDVKVLRDPGGGLGEAAASAVELMGRKKQWIPGKQRGNPVKVAYTLPVNFKLK